MFIGACQVTLHFGESASLKDKRQVVRSVLARLRNQFEVAAAEVAHQESWQLTALGIAYVSGDAGHARTVLERAVRYIEETRPDCLITDVQMEVLTLEG